MPKSKEYLDEKDQIVDDLENVYREKDEKTKRKVLMGRLYKLWKDQDLKTENKPIYNIYLNGEGKNSKRRIFSKIFKLDENNQYGFAMTKPPPIGIFKKEEHVDIEILNVSIANFDVNAKIGEIFVADIEFNAYGNPRGKMYNEVYSCIFQPKSKVSVDRRSVYQLLSTMRMGKKDNILTYVATEKAHATLDPKKHFPMFIDHIHFLTKRAGWTLTKVHHYYTFEQEPFKKDYILGNQKSRQEAVAQGDEAQGNFHKLLNNANFGFECRNILEAKIKNIQDKYNDVENLPFDEQPFVETLKEAEIKEVSEKFNRKANRKSIRC